MTYRDKLLDIVAADCIDQHDKIIESLKYSGQSSHVKIEGQTMEEIHKDTILSLINTSIHNLKIELQKIGDEK